MNAHILTTALIASLAVFIFSCNDPSSNKYNRNDELVVKMLEVKTKRISLKTEIYKYSPPKKAYYGSIHMCNQTADTIQFNFRQFLQIEGRRFAAYCDMFPNCYDKKVFFIPPGGCHVYSVVWPVHKERQPFENITIIPDTSCVVLHPGNSTIKQTGK